MFYSRIKKILALVIETSPPSQDDAAVDVDDIAQSLSDDYTRAEFIRDRLVPKAVLFFTGEALEEDGDGDDDVSHLCGFGLSKKSCLSLFYFSIVVCVCLDFMQYDDFDDDEDDLEDDYNPEKQVRIIVFGIELA